VNYYSQNPGAWLNGQWWPSLFISYLLNFGYNIWTKKYAPFPTCEHIIQTILQETVCLTFKIYQTGIHIFKLCNIYTFIYFTIKILTHCSRFCWYYLFSLETLFCKFDSWGYSCDPIQRVFILLGKFPYS